MSELPLAGISATYVPEWPDDAVSALAAAAEADDIDAALRDVAAGHPEFLPVWAALAERALDADDPVAAYAFARVGYHRGLDTIRAAGWRGQGQVPWEHGPNRGFLRALDALRKAALAIAEPGEPERCHDFLIQLDPSDPFELGRRGA